MSKKDDENWLFNIRYDIWITANVLNNDRVYWKRNVKRNKESIAYQAKMERELNKFGIRYTKFCDVLQTYKRMK